MSFTSLAVYAVVFIALLFVLTYYLTLVASRSWHRGKREFVRRMITDNTKGTEHGEV